MIFRLIFFRFLSLSEQCKGKKIDRYVQLVDKLTDNFALRFSDFSLGKYLLLFIENPFLVTNIATFSIKAKDIGKWIDAAKVQLELFEFQKNVALKESFCDCTFEQFWSEKVFPNNFPILRKLAVHILALFGSTYCCESAFSKMNSVMALVGCERSGRTGPLLKNIKKWPPYARYCSIFSE